MTLEEAYRILEEIGAPPFNPTLSTISYQEAGEELCDFVCDVCQKPQICFGGFEWPDGRNICIRCFPVLWAKSLPAGLIEALDTA